MLYLDTSVVTAYYCPEPLSEQVEKFLISENEQVAISHLTEVELYSAISRKIRENNLDTYHGKKIIKQFENHVREAYFCRLLLNEKHFKKAKEWISRFSTPLRTLDALHLAIAALGDLTLVTSDLNLIRSAGYFGIRVTAVR